MKVFSIFILFSFLELSNETIFKNIITASSLKYDRFHTVNYKTILLPSNLYDLTITVNFIKWNGFLALCPKKVNITAVLQYGTFPFFKYDSQFDLNISESQRIDISFHFPKITNKQNTFSLKSPKSGNWFLGSIFDSNDDFNHYIICSADIRIEMIGLITPPSISILIPSSSSHLTIPLSIINSENILLELMSHNHLAKLEINLLCPGSTLIISSAMDTVPEIQTIAEARKRKEIYNSGNVVLNLTRPVMSLRILMQIRSLYGTVNDSQLFVHVQRTNDNKSHFMAPAVSVKESMFSYRFVSVEAESRTIAMILSPGKVITQPFYIEPIKDQGGILTIDLKISMVDRKSSDNCSMLMCVHDTGYSVVEDVREAVIRQEGCTWSRVQSVDQEATLRHSFYYPRWGWWYVNVVADSSNDQSYSWETNLTISGTRCRPGPLQCSGKGVCLLSAYDSGLISSCHCSYSYYGLNCQYQHVIDSAMIARSIYRRKWLVLSNLVFLLAILVSALQRMYLLSVVYLVTMVSSMLYHVCSVDDIAIKACILPIDQLTYYDHIAAALSIWVTLMDLTTMPTKAQSLLNVAMICALLVMGNNIQRSVWMYAVPVIVGGGLIVICWTYRMYTLKRIFPPIDWWMLGLIPGMALVISGFIFFRLSNYEQYPYFLYHSIWHILISLSICFILPNSRRWHKALTKTPSMDLIGPERGSHIRKWRKLKKNINYYLHLDILIDYLVLRNPNCAILKSY